VTTKTRISTLVPYDSAQRLARSLNTSYDVELSGSVRELVHELESGRAVVTVVDPCMLRPDALDALIAAFESSGAPILLYTRLCAESATQILDFVRRVPAELVCFGANDEGDMLNTRLAILTTPSVQSLMLKRLVSELTTLHGDLKRRIVGMLGGLPIEASVESFCHGCCAHRRTVERRLGRGGFRGIQRVLDAMRVARHWDSQRLQRPLRSLDSRDNVPATTLRERYRRFVGVSPSRARAEFSATDMARALAVAIRNAPD
jgi:hypothetical protein